MDAAVLDYVRELHGGSHVLHPFDDPKSRDQVFVEFVRGAIQKDLAVVHLSDDVERDRRLVSELGILEKPSKQIRIIPIGDAYKPATYTRQVPLEFWMKELKQTEAAGFAGLRGSVDDTILDRWGLFPELVEAERIFGRTIASNITVLCMYDANVLNLEQFLKPLLSAHGHVIFPGFATSLI